MRSNHRFPAEQTCVADTISRVCGASPCPYGRNDCGLSRCTETVRYVMSTVQYTGLTSISGISSILQGGSARDNGRLAHTHIVMSKRRTCITTWASELRWAAPMTEYWIKQYPRPSMSAARSREFEQETGVAKPSGLHLPWVVQYPRSIHSKVRFNFSQAFIDIIRYYR